MSSDSEWFDPSQVITNSHKLTDIFGYWPSFHDAEVHSLRLSVAEGQPWLTDSESPVLDMHIHLFEMTKEVDEEGYFILDKHTLTHLRFRNIEGLSLSYFSFQNCLFSLDFGTEPKTFSYGGGPAEGPPPNVITVKIDSSVGLEGEFKCSSAEVISAIPCDEDGFVNA
jgi:hypothetical protein